MGRHKKLTLSCLGGAVALFLCNGVWGPFVEAKSKKSQGVKIEELDGKMRVVLDGEPFTELVWKDTAKPILYPVLGPHAVPMTRNYPMKKDVEGEAKDHPHHRSLWFTHGDVNGVDFWGEGRGRGQIVHKECVAFEGGPKEGWVTTRNEWVGPGDEIQCTDTRTMSFRSGKNCKMIDFVITIYASHGKVVFGDTKEGSMGIRTHPALRLMKDPKAGVTSSNGKAVNSEGDRGPFGIWGKRARWVDYWGDIDGKVVGIAIFDHPENPRHPTWWHARQYGLVAANPFGVHHFEKKPDGTGDLEVEAGKEITFRYRFVFHEGDVETAKVDKLYGEYAESHPDLKGLKQE